MEKGGGFALTAEAVVDFISLQSSVNTCRE